MEVTTWARCLCALLAQESKGVAKRRAEEQEAAKANRAAKKMRVEMRRRGHVRVSRRGGDPTADLREKALSRLATRGVVLLFNAVAKTQKQRQEAGGPGAKAAKLSKAAFLSQLQKGGGAGGAAGAQGRGSVLGLGKPAGAATGAGAPGWRVLQEDFTGLPGEGGSVLTQ